MRILIITGGRIDEDFALSLLEKEKFERETWKRELIEYSASSYRNLRNMAIRKMDPIVCEILDRFAVQYDVALDVGD